MSTGAVEVLFFAVGDSLYRMGDGTMDGPTQITYTLEPNWVSPDGAGGEAIFTTLYVTTTRQHEGTATIRVTPLLDGVEQETMLIVLEPAPSEITEIRELPLTTRLMRDEMEVARLAQRGTWFAVRLEGEAPLGHLIFESVETETELVREYKQVRSTDG